MITNPPGAVNETLQEEIRDEAKRIIWVLSSSAAKANATDRAPKLWDLASESNRSEQMMEALRAIEWLSAIACDDWPPSDVEAIYQELDDYLVSPFLDHEPSWTQFCQLVARAAGHPVKYGPQEFKPAPYRQPSRDDYISFGRHLRYLERAPWPLRLLSFYKGIRYWSTQEDRRRGIG